MNLVEIEGVWTRLGHDWVHQGVDLQVARGELVALVGGSGAGKTTLLRHIIGLTEPTRGRVRLFGEEVNSGRRDVRRRRRERIGVLFQHGALFSALTVFDNVAFPLREFGGLHEDEVEALVMARLAQVELESRHAWLMPSQLSGGMTKRVALARALALEPELLLLDEPTAGLDPDRSARFVHLILSLHEQLGLTMIFVTHDLETLSTLASRVAVIAEHRILVTGSLEEVQRFEHPFTRNFFRYRAALDERGEF